jgi:hypothetical protein
MQTGTSDMDGLQGFIEIPGVAQGAWLTRGNYAQRALTDPWSVFDAGTGTVEKQVQSLASTPREDAAAMSIDDGTPRGRPAPEPHRVGYWRGLDADQVNCQRHRRSRTAKPGRAPGARPRLARRGGVICRWQAGPALGLVLDGARLAWTILRGNP